MKKLLMMYLLACGSMAMAETSSSAADFYYWDKNEMVSGTVTKFTSDFGLKNNVAIVSIANSDIKLPSQYREDTSNCRAHLVNTGDNSWTLMRLLCDYQTNKEVRIYYSASIDLPPLNIGDKINITALQPVPIGGYYKMMLLDDKWSDVDHFHKYSNAI